MSKSWPPSPCVEDEEASLAREHGSDTSDTEQSYGKGPDVSRGAVDQYPIILDVNAKEEPGNLHEAANVTKQTTRDRQKQPSPSYAKPSNIPAETNNERRFLFVPGSSTDNESSAKPKDQFRQRSKSTTRIDGDKTPRGRPNVARINTDMGTSDVHSMATGQRRAPSPYAYHSHSATLSSSEAKPRPTMLSPESAAASSRLPNSGVRRSRSTRPEPNNAVTESSDSDNKSKYRRHRSKSRPRPKDEGIDVRASADEHHNSGRTERHRSRRRRSRDSSPKDRVSTTTNHRSAHGNITPPQTPSLPRESPYTSAAEESDRRRRDKSRPRYADRRQSKESPYTSAAEDSFKKWSGDDKMAGAGLRRESVNRYSRPQIDLYDARHPRMETSNTVSARTPKSLEDSFQKAWEANKRKVAAYGDSRSAHPSPLSSPPRSPPRTPRREMRNGDYFAMNQPVAGAPKQRSRPPSIDENPFKPLTALLSAAIGAPLAAKVMPTLSRSSTASLETPISSSQSSLPSGQRSRKPSPVHENPRTVSRTPSTTSKEEIIAPRSMAQINNYDRPVSRAGSVASQEGGPYRSATYPPQADRPVSRAGSINDPLPSGRTAYVIHEEVPASRNGTYVVPASVHPPPAQRASSYSSSYDPIRSRPSQRRTYSSTTGVSIMPASSQYQHQASNLSHSYTPAGIMDGSSNASIPVVEPKLISFPKCPHQTAMAGYHQWYTIQGMQNFDICTTCMQVLGSSSFRDYCVPSPYRSPTEAISCSLSRPWIRIAVAQCLQNGNPNITLLRDLHETPTSIWPCPGKASDVRKWYHVVDPVTKSPVSNFDVCTACVRSVELIFPDLKKEQLLQRPADKLSQERTCHLTSGSKHFYSMINELGKLAEFSRKKDLRKKDISNFVDFVKRKTRYRECQKSAMLATPLWHFIPGLPEFTICEECFEEAVWPMKDKAIARDVGKTLQPVSTYQQGQRSTGVSCQLYSERMRRIFREAVQRNDMALLRNEAILRYNMEHQLQEKQKLCTQEANAGLDRRAEIAHIGETWKAYE